MQAMRATLIFILTVAIAVNQISCDKSPKFAYKIPKLDSSIVARKISLNRLSKEYKKLHGQYIETKGTFFCAFESFIIYKNSFPNKDSEFWMETNRHLIPDSAWHVIDKVSRHKIRIKGRIDTSDHGHLNQYPATINDIYFFEEQ